MPSPAWFAVNAQLPADSMVTVLPDTVQTAGDAEPNTNAAVDAPGVADTVKLPPGAKTGAAGFDAKPVITCEAAVIATFKFT